VLVPLGAGVLQLLVTGVQLIELEIAEVLDIDHCVARFVDGMDELVELEINCAGITILRVLDEEDHQKGHDGGARIDDELPAIGVVEDGAEDGPDNNDADRARKRPLRPKPGGDAGRAVPEPIFGDARTLLWRFLQNRSVPLQRTASAL